MEKNLKQQTVNGMFWQFMQKIGNQSIGFIVSVILARILLPDDYGVVALAGMFTALFAIFSDGGLGPALVQKKDADSLDFDTLFTTQLVFSCITYVIIFFSAPYFALLFDKPLLCDIIRVSALGMPLGALGGVQNSILTRRMKFKWFFYVSFIGLAVSAVVGLTLAYSGYGAWALVFQGLSSSVVTTIVIFCFIDWHPHFRFSYKRFKLLFSQGIRYMGTALIGKATGQVQGYALGLKYSPADLAYYSRGDGLPMLICNNIDSTIQGVLFPALSQIQDNPEAVKKALRRAIRISTYILFPMLFGLSAISDKLIIIIFTEKWAASIPFMQLSCFCLAIGIMGNVNIQALKARGRIDVILKMEFIKKPLMVLIIIGTMFISPLAIMWGMFFFNIFVYFVNSYPNKRNINYSYKEQLKDVAYNFTLALLMAILVYLVGRININLYFDVIVQVLFGITFYSLVSWYTKNESMLYIINYIKERKINHE
ncbi:MAG: lipopolysaccharide biosynthesis protein [Prevotella sp.]|nr:lipopolysaccharide biosynthesis protein [Prevotella sp.]